ncbi:MAG: sigma-70 family RNA polymerase sigma factor [Anaerolineaceae bacterium]|nr:sigma-70 family RNA polymerase sigma factor [Anaerolineaceae bacterium]
MIKKQRKSVDISIQALKEGDRSEYARLVDEYSGMIFRLALKILNNQQDAEDVLQETFIKAFQHIPTFQGHSSISTWLYRISTNEALMMIRKRKPETGSVSLEEYEDHDDNEPMQIEDWCCLPEEELLSAETKEYLDEAIQNISNNLKVVFLLRDVEGFSVRETAEILEISEASVKTRLSRARMRLQQELSKYFSPRISKEEKNAKS